MAQQRVRLAGYVRGCAEPLLRSRVLLDGDFEPFVSCRLHDIVLEVEGDASGPVVAVECPRTTLVLAPERRSVGSWRKLGRGAVADGHPPDLVPDGAQLEVVRESIAEGDLVTLWAEVLEQDFEPDRGGLRVSASARPTRVRALAIAAGPQREARLDDALAAPELVGGKAARPPLDHDDPSTGGELERPPGRPARAVSIGCVVLALALCTAPAWLPLPASWGRGQPLWLRGLAMACVALASAVLSWPDRRLPWLRRGDARWGFHQNAGGMRPRAIFASVLLAGLAMWLPTLAAPRACAVAAALLGLATLGTWLENRRIYRALARVAEPGARFAAGVVGAWQGRAVDATPATVAGQATAIGVVSDFEEGVGSDPDRLSSSKLHVEGGFLVDTGAGAIEVRPTTAVWGSLLERRRGGFRRYQLQQLIPVGGRCVVAGRLAQGKSTGADTPAGADAVLVLADDGAAAAFVLGASARGRPVRFAALVRRRRRVVLATLLGLTAATLALLLLATR